MPSLLRHVCPVCQSELEPGEEVCPKDGAKPLIFKADDPDELIGQTIDGRYKVTGRIGEGGMGAVFLAEQLTMGRLVALKVLKRKLEGDQDIVKRFLREVKAVALLSHPNIITVHDFGKTEDGLLYIAMEYLDGETLSSAIHRGPVPVVDCLRIVIQICGALGEAHSKGVVHRDLKPDNVMLTKVGDREAHVHVLDFGIAKITGGTGTTQITQAGFAVGTPEYMSPEQASGDPNLTYASDLYSLGCILYQLLTGKLSFHGYAEMATLLAHVNEMPEPPSQLFPSLGIPTVVDDLTMWALEKAPTDRPETALVFARKAEAVLADLQAGGDATPLPESPFSPYPGYGDDIEAGGGASESMARATTPQVRSAMENPPALPATEIPLAPTVVGPSAPEPETPAPAPATDLPQTVVQNRLPSRPPPGPPTEITGVTLDIQTFGEEGARSRRILLAAAGGLLILAVGGLLLWNPQTETSEPASTAETSTAPSPTSPASATPKQAEAPTADEEDPPRIAVPFLALLRHENST